MEQTNHITLFSRKRSTTKYKVTHTYERIKQGRQYRMQCQCHTNRTIFVQISQQKVVQIGIKIENHVFRHQEKRQYP